MSQNNPVAESIETPAVSTADSVSSDAAETKTKEAESVPASEYIMDISTALQMPCPIRDYKGKTLGDVLRVDPGAIKWIAERYNKDMNVKEAARYICEHASQNY